MVAEARKSGRAKVQTMVVRYRAAMYGAFVEKQCWDVSHGGTFVQTEEPLLPGTLLRFDIQCADARAFHGVGRVVWKREETSPASPAGMGIKFIKMDDAS